MKKLILRRCLILSAIAAFQLIAANLSAATLIGFDVANGTAGGSYQNATRSFTTTTTSQALLEFDTTTPIFAANGQAPLYGGLNVVNSATGGTMGGTSAAAQGNLRFHDNNPDGWPNVPKVFANISDSSGGVSYNNLTMAMVFKKEDFANFSAAPVGFDSSSTLQLHMTDWHTRGSPGQPVEIRFLILEGSQYYVSEAVRTAHGAGTLSFTDFNDNSAAGQRWAPISLSSTSFGIPASLTFGAVDFNNVLQVGFIGEGSRSYGAQFGFDSFSATGIAIPEPSKGALIIGAAGVLFLRRRRHG